MRYRYLDHAATTALRPEVRAAMEPYLDARFGNASSIHRFGRDARNALEQARERVAAALGAHRREIVFTSGGTEADNLAVLGRWRAHRAAGEAGGAVVASAIEHSAVTGAAEQAAREGAELILLGVDQEGRVDPAVVEEALLARPCVVSVMWGNNEVGTVQPIAAVAAACRARNVAFHSDAVQAFGKVRVRVDEVACDLLAVSAHKIGGPKGVGALYVREGVQLLPLGHGGGQERALRPGTENVAGAVGLAAAAELAVAEQAAEGERLERLRATLLARCRERVGDVAVNGSSAHHLPHILHLSVPGVDPEALLVGLDLEGVAASGGSACHSGTVQHSPVLGAMGRAWPGHASVRFSLGHDTTLADVEFAADVLGVVVTRARSVAAG